MRAIALLVLLPIAAQAAEPEVCRGYATKLLNTHMTWMWNRAYSGCLNMEANDPQPPDNAEGAMRIIDPALTPLAAIMSAPEPPPRPTPHAAGKSGFAPGSDQWKQWCRQNYPRSFDEKTGTVILPTSRHRVRTPCPG